MNEELQASLKKIEEDFIPEVKKTFGHSLKAVILYGSAARGTFVYGSSDINLLIIIEEPDPDRIVELGADHAKLIKKHRISLHVLSEGEFIRSADIFPMEYLDIQEAGKILYGESVADKLTITKKHLRHQVEERLRGNINALRQALIASRGSSRLLSQLLRESYGTFISPLRGLLRLKNEDLRTKNHPETDIELLDRVYKEYGVDTKPLKEIYTFREGGRTDARRLAVNLVIFLTTLVRRVDEMEAE
ncbi:MAG: nucleotidyltransferase domain-containing protein [Spirochaetaceae bacterium]